jgi:uncharacterized protein
VGHYALATRRPLAVGDEVTNDYATSTGEPGFVMACRCGSELCRGTITGDDWQQPELQERYRGHWIPALQQKITAPPANRRPPGS